MKILPIYFSFIFLCLPVICIAQIDKNATRETKALFKNLKKIAGKHILFGHQHATEYGHGWFDEANRSDVKSVTGSHPAVIGVDLMGLSGVPENKIAANLKSLHKNVIATYNRGGLTTVAWHFNNPVSEDGFYWKDSLSVAAMAEIKPGGASHEKYKEILDRVASFAKGAIGANGTLAPMIFRPFHEFDGDWFWWGKAHTSREDFIAVWQFTVSYLRDTKQVHNFLYAFSPDNGFNSEVEFLERYPGDQWVDMLGMDNYADFGRDGKYNLEAGLYKLRIVSEYAVKTNKLAAFTETGLESIPNPNWWTEVLLKTLKSENIKMAYVLVWRNDIKSPTHFYAPYPGQVSEKDFIKFYDDPFTLFENDLKGLYR